MLCLHQKFLAFFCSTPPKSTCSSASWFWYCEKGLMFNRVLALWQGLLHWSKVYKAVPRRGTCTGSTEAFQENKDCEEMGQKDTNLHVIIQLLYFSAHLTNAYEILWDSKRKSNPASQSGEDCLPSISSKHTVETSAEALKRLQTCR